MENAVFRAWVTPKSQSEDKFGRKRLFESFAGFGLRSEGLRGEEKPDRSHNQENFKNDSQVFHFKSANGVQRN